MVGMFQKEVAARVCSVPGNKTYGILSVLLQAFYDIEYLFTVDEQEFDPPPKVKSGVMRMTRKTDQNIGIEPKFLKQIVKLSFNQRRKTLRNSLKSMINERGIDSSDPIFNKRPEDLGWEEFVKLGEMLAV
jgi:16S rRNA (adenine1518-N6/adenine1519-N6)-dimethyltransferase